MATSPSVALFNTDPNIQAQAALLQQRQAIANALLQDGLKPVDLSNRTIGGVAYHVSPFEGLAKALQAYGGQKMSQDVVGQQAKLAGQAYGNLLDRYKPGDTPQFNQDQMQGAESAGMNGDGMGPPDPMKMARYLQGQTPQGGPNPNNPMGIPAQILAQKNAGMMDDETFRALISGYQATDATRMALQGKTDPAAANRQALIKQMTDPKIYAMQQAGLTPEQINAALFGEAAKAGEIERKGGNEFINPVLGSSGIVPKLPEGANPVGPVAPNGGLPGGVAPMPGAAPTMGRNSEAAATGKADGEFHMVTLADGSVVPVRGKNIPAVNPQSGVQGNFAGDPATVSAAIANIKDPQERANAQAAFDEQMKRQGGRLQLGQSTAGKVIQEEAGKTMAALPQQVAQTKQTITGLENALHQIQQLQKSGPGVSKAVNALSIVNNMGIPLEKGDVNGYQTLKKYIENSAASAAAAGGFTGSDARFEQFKAGQPNAETMNAGSLEGAIRYVLSQQDAALHQGNYLLNQAGNDPSKVQRVRQAWAKEYNPRYFEVQRLPPDAQKAAVGQMSPSDAAAFLAWRKAQKGR